MDRNIKAELSALKNEIINKIDNLEKRLFKPSTNDYEPNPTFMSIDSPNRNDYINDHNDMSRLKNIVENTIHNEEFKQVYNEMKNRVHAIHHSAMFPLDENYGDNTPKPLEYNILKTLQEIDEKFPIENESDSFSQKLWEETGYNIDAKTPAEIEEYTESLIDLSLGETAGYPGSPLTTSSDVNIDDIPEIVENNKKYLEDTFGISSDGKEPFSKDELTEFDKYNEKNLALLIDTPLMKNEITRIKNEDRRIVYIDTGNLSTEQTNEVIKNIKSEIHQRRIPNQVPGARSILDAAYNPLEINDGYIGNNDSRSEINRKYIRPLTINDLIEANNLDHYKETEAAKDEVIESTNIIEDLKIEKKLPTPESYPGTEFVRPDWLTDVANKPIEQHMKDIRKWDETSQEMFIESWNNDFGKRFDILNATLTTFILCVVGYSSGKINVSSAEDAKEALGQYEAAGRMKTKIIDCVNNKDRVVLDQLKLHKTPVGFTLYYRWINELVDEIVELDESKEIKLLIAEKKLNLKLLITGADRALLIYAIDTLRQMLDDHELDMFELKVIDPRTFEWAKVPEDRQKAYKDLSYTNYRKDLSNAYKFIVEQDVAGALKGAGMSLNDARVNSGKEYAD